MDLIQSDEYSTYYGLGLKLYIYSMNSSHGGSPANPVEYDVIDNSDVTSFGVVGSNYTTNISVHGDRLLIGTRKALYMFGLLDGLNPVLLDEKDKNYYHCVSGTSVLIESSFSGSFIYAIDADNDQLELLNDQFFPSALQDCQAFGPLLFMRSYSVDDEMDNMNIDDPSKPYSVGKIRPEEADLHTTNTRLSHQWKLLYHLYGSFTI